MADSQSDLIIQFDDLMSRAGVLWQNSSCDEHFLEYVKHQETLVSKYEELRGELLKTKLSKEELQHCLDFEKTQVLRLQKELEKTHLDQSSNISITRSEDDLDGPRINKRKRTSSREEDDEPFSIPKKKSIKSHLASLGLGLRKKSFESLMASKKDQCVYIAAQCLPCGKKIKFAAPLKCVACMRNSSTNETVPTNGDDEPELSNVESQKTTESRTSSVSTGEKSDERADIESQPFDQSSFVLSDPSAILTAMQKISEMMRNTDKVIANSCKEITSNTNKRFKADVHTQEPQTMPEMVRNNEKYFPSASQSQKSMPIRKKKIVGKESWLDCECGKKFKTKPRWKTSQASHQCITNYFINYR